MSILAGGPHFGGQQRVFKQKPKGHARTRRAVSEEPPAPADAGEGKSQGTKRRNAILKGTDEILAAIDRALSLVG